MLAVLLIIGIVSTMNSIPLTIHKVYGYSKFLTGATPRGNMAYFPKLQKHFENSPVPIERTIIARTSIFNVKSLVGPWPFVLHGLKENDARYLIARIGLGELNGRMPQPGKPEAVISEPVAKNLKLQIGSTLLSPDEERMYSPNVVTVVGIFDGDEWFAGTSYEYLSKNHYPPIDVLILFAKDQPTQRKLDEWTETSLKGERALTYTYPQLERETADSFRTLFVILNVVIGLLVTVITIMMGMLINIYLSQRIIEFGLLQAIGFQKSRLVIRAMKEAALVVIGGWFAGLALSYVLLFIIESTIMSPRGYYLDAFNLFSYAYTIPIPVAILTAAVLTVWWRFLKFDPISVVERRIV